MCQRLSETQCKLDRSCAICGGKIKPSRQEQQENDRAIKAFDDMITKLVLEEIIYGIPVYWNRPATVPAEPTRLLIRFDSNDFPA